MWKYMNGRITVYIDIPLISLIILLIRTSFIAFIVTLIIAEPTRWRTWNARDPPWRLATGGGLSEASGTF